METLYTKRTAHFFVESIDLLKQESGGQRWNEICEDTAQLFAHLCKKQGIETKLAHVDIWQMFFEPAYSHELIELLCENQFIHPVFFTCIHALLDPPTSWWQAQFR